MLLRPLLPLVLACFLVAGYRAGAVAEDTLIPLLEHSERLDELTVELEELEARISSRSGDRRSQTKAKTELRHQINEEKKKLSKCSQACREWFKATGGRDINAQDAKGRTLLMLVAATGNSQAMELLLAEGPRLDLQDHHGKSALDYEREAQQGNTLQTHMERLWVMAFSASDTQSITMLLEAGLSADTHAGDEPAPVLALLCGNTEVLSQLLSHPASIKARSREGHDLMELAIHADNSKAISMLAMAGMGKERLSNGNSPLFHLLTRGSTESLKAFLDAATCLDEAARRALPSQVVRLGNVEKVGLVITGADVANAEDEHRNIPVHEAARRGDMKILRLVLERGGSRSATNAEGESTLMHAALSGKPEVVTLVLEGLSARDIHHKNKKGQTAADYAKESGNTQISDILRQAAHTP